jgi:hypothetical protein
MIPSPSQQIKPKTIQTLPHLERDLISGVLAQTPCIMEDSQHIPYITSLPLSRNDRPWTELLVATSRFD